MTLSALHIVAPSYPLCSIPTPVLLTDWLSTMPALGWDHAPYERGVRERLRIFSTYDTPLGRFWIITASDRSSTTILLPHEY